MFDSNAHVVCPKKQTPFCKRNDKQKHPAEVSSVVIPNSSEHCCDYVCMNVSHTGGLTAYRCIARDIMSTTSWGAN